MLATGIGLLTDARAQRRAVPAFNTYTLESTRAICEAAASTGLPAIVAAGSSSFRGVGREPLAAAAIAAATHAPVAIGVHLDHATDPGEIAACIALGYSSVMIDGSRLPFEDNVAVTRAVVEHAHAHGVWVEGELGGVGGDEDASSDATAGALTDPGRAAEFVARTGVDALAAAVGTVHGFTTAPVHVDVDRLGAIAAAVGVPLVLHGASGLSDAELAAAVLAGVAKVNVNAELRRAYLGALRAGLADGGDDVARLQDRAVAAMRDVAAAKLTALARPGGDTRKEIAR
ncbi:MAG TPA: class II fructose-bisphosphate aldolase [Solirubrobacteraceae bacterium]|nr:class II fructose-bisphosphate aldolase [Solirubrobacteraceae bacterium]